MSDSNGQTRHHVTMSKVDCGRLVGKSCPPERGIEAAFLFLLDREPKEAILPYFDVRVIALYFPNFEAELPRYIASVSTAGMEP
ncbi:hypothetical protein [Mesorhizobium xinjiangense]|uniref:hypothetical protein n=1 Tax=Mesorhizobium xinjiangense TaxID=2678685 RepID=UPI001F2D2C21|nr:hypothetical protein [Mesorhizobium xinjiangense]